MSNTVCATLDATIQGLWLVFVYHLPFPVLRAKVTIDGMQAMVVQPRLRKGKIPEDATIPGFPSSVLPLLGQGAELRVGQGRGELIYLRANQRECHATMTINRKFTSIWEKCWR